MAHPMWKHQVIFYTEQTKSISFTSEVRRVKGVVGGQRTGFMNTVNKALLEQSWEAHFQD